MLLLFKPFQVGDYIIQDQAGGTEGTVYKVEMFYTTLITIDNKHVIIPNGKLSNSTIINVTAQNLRNLEIKVEISYDSDIKKAKKLLQHILQEDPGTKSDKDMLVFVDELADSAVVMGLRVWVPTDNTGRSMALNEKSKNLLMPTEFPFRIRRWMYMLWRQIKTNDNRYIIENMK